MTRNTTTRAVSVLLMAWGLAAVAFAGVEVDLTGTVQIDDDTGIYLSVSSRHFDRDEADVRRWYRQSDDPDDLAVALFLARRTQVPPDQVYELRRTGLGWWEVGLRLGLPADAWFPAVRRDPGPPYGHAYGHWKKHGKKSPTEVRFADADLRHLVAVHVLHGYFGITVEAAMDWRASGRKLEDITAREHRSRRNHRAGGVAGAAMSGGPPAGKGKAKGKIRH